VVLAFDCMASVPSPSSWRRLPLARHLAAAASASEDPSQYPGVRARPSSARSLRDVARLSKEGGGAARAARRHSARCAFASRSRPARWLLHTATSRFPATTGTPRGRGFGAGVFQSWSKMSDWSDRRDRRRTSAATGAEAVSFLDETSRSVQHGMSRIMTDMPSPTACEASDELPGRMLINAPVRTAAPPPAAALAPPLTAPTAPAATATETVDSTMASALSMITASAAETAVHVSNRKASVAALPEGSVSVASSPAEAKRSLIVAPACWEKRRENT